MGRELDEWMKTASHEQRMEHYAKRTEESAKEIARGVGFLVLVALINLLVVIFAALEAVRK